jgi:galactoside O-acetyltransferase
MDDRERIRRGLLFTDMTGGLPEDRLRGKELAADFNLTRPSEVERRAELMIRMFGAIGERCWIEPPIHFAYGTNIFFGSGCYVNFNLTVLDDTTVTFGDNVLIAPNVTISAVGHPVHPELRPHGEMYAFPVTICSGVWLGVGVIVNPGITIGENSVIGAGSVVTRDIPANVIAVGNPCRVLRPITERDREFYYRDLHV